VHPKWWKRCARLAEGRLQWAGTRGKVLYLMVRMARMGCEMWRLRCRDIYSYAPGSWEAQRVEAVLGTASGVEGECPRVRVEGWDERRAAEEVAAQLDAREAIDQWEEGERPEHLEGCGVCTREMRVAKHCRQCDARHCCGTEEECRACQGLEEEQADEFIRGAYDLLDPVAEMA